MRRPALLALLLPLALGACGDGATAPAGPDEPRLAVAVAGVTPGRPVIGFLLDRTPFLACEVRVDVAASGEGEGEFTGGMLRWYAGAQRATPFDSQHVSAAELREVMDGDGRIVAGEARTSTWQMAATAPFFGDVELRYRVDDAEQAVTASFRCGPSVPAEAPPPEITSVDVTTSGGSVAALAPGDTLEVTFDAVAPASLWRSTVTLSGGCALALHEVESLGTNVARTVRVPLPADCTAGEPIQVTVSVMDAAARSTTRAVPASLLLANE